MFARSRGFCPFYYLLLMTVTSPYCLQSGWAQVTVQIKAIDIGHISQTLSNTSATSNTTLLESYTFPEGFSNPLDWFVKPYENIPPEGLNSILYHPVPGNACTDPLDKLRRDLCVSERNQPKINYTYSELNLTRLALVDGYHICTQEKLEVLETAGFDGMITFSHNDTNQDVNSRVLDSTTNMFVDVVSSEFPVVVVSEEFYRTLLEQASHDMSLDSDCLNTTSLTIVTIRSDPSRQAWIEFGVSLAFVVVLVGLPLLTCLCICCCICYTCAAGPRKICRSCCSCKCCRSTGVYEVNQVHVRVLGDNLVLRHPHLEEEETSFSLHSNTAQPVTGERFQRVFENDNTPSTRKYDLDSERNTSCAICLEDFEGDETVHALACDENHVFHPRCIELWLETHSVCPVCRTFIIQPHF